MHRRIEHDVRHPAVAPLTPEQAEQFRSCSLWCPVLQTERNERAVPAPLVRIEAARRHGCVPMPVVAQHTDGGALQRSSIRRGQLHASCRIRRTDTGSASSTSPERRHSYASSPE